MNFYEKFNFGDEKFFNNGITINTHVSDGENLHLSADSDNNLIDNDNNCVKKVKVKYYFLILMK